MQLAAKTKEAAAQFVKRLAEFHVPVVWATAHHPNLQTIPVTNVFQGGPAR